MYPPSNQKISIGDRLVEMIVDHGIMSAVAAIFAIPFFASTMINAFKTISHKTQFGPLNIFNNPLIYIYYFGMALYLCKDVIGGQSIGKRLLKYQIVNDKTGQPASSFRCFVRNLTCMLWPVEAVVAMINTSRRLGDRIAGTRLIKFDRNLPKAKLNFIQVAICLIIGYAIAFSMGWVTTNIPKRVFPKNSYHYSANIPVKDPASKCGAMRTLIIEPILKNFVLVISYI